MSMTNLTEAEVIRMAQKALSDNEMGYDPTEEFVAKFAVNTKLRDGQLKPVWVVSYVTPSGIFEQHDHFMYISDESREVLYIMTQSGYIG